MKRTPTSKHPPSAPPGTKVAPAVAPTPVPVNFKNLLVPLDFSPSSRQSLRQAVALAGQFQAKLTLLTVIEPMGTPDFAASFPLMMDEAKLCADANAELKKLVKATPGCADVVERILVRFGRTFHEIAETAQAHHSDLIVIATHGRTGFKHVLLGSNTERVVRHAPCPVLVLRISPDQLASNS